MPRSLTVPLLALLTAACNGGDGGGGDSASDSTASATTTEPTGGDETGLTGGETESETESETGGETGGETEGETAGGGTAGGPTFEPFEPPPPEYSAECLGGCEVGCTITLLRGLHGPLAVAHDGEHVLARDTKGRVGLWRADDRAQLLMLDGTEDAALEGGVLGLTQGGITSLRDAATDTLLSSFPTPGPWGLAADASYVWRLDADGLSRLDLGGELQWTIPFPLGAENQALALADTLHLYTSATPSELHHIDALTGVETTTAIDGEFGGWFADRPRAWTHDLGSYTYQVYDDDGGLLHQGNGVGGHGWSDRLLTFDGLDGLHNSYRVVDLVEGSIVRSFVMIWAFSGPSFIARALTEDGEQDVLVDLGDPGLAAEPLPYLSAIPFHPHRSFAFREGRWALGSQDGLLVDQDDSPLTPGPIDQVLGAASGRIVATTRERAPFLASAQVFDLDDAACVATHRRASSRTESRLLADDGSVLATTPNPVSASPLRFIDPATGALLGDSAAADGSWSEGQIAANGALASFRTSGFSGLCAAGVVPVAGGAPWFLGDLAALPAVSPSGDRFAITPVACGLGNTYAGATSELRDSDGVLASFEGLTWGFVDDDTLLVGLYEGDEGGTCGGPESCSTYLSARLVATDGSILATPAIPELRNFQRVRDHELFARDTLTLWDLDQADPLWQAPVWISSAAPAGPDFIAQSTGTDLILHKIR